VEHFRGPSLAYKRAQLTGPTLAGLHCAVPWENVKNNSIFGLGSFGFGILIDGQLSNG